RERREDIPLLAAQFLKDANKKHGTNVTSIAEPVRKAMTVHEWKGNVRELRNVIESMVLQDQDGELGVDEFQEDNPLRKLLVPEGGSASPANLVGRPLSEVERYYIEQTLQLTNNNRDQAAKMLGIGERTLYRVMQDWKLQDKIRQTLSESSGKVEEAAKRLGMKAGALERKLKRWGLATAATEQG